MHRSEQTLLIKWVGLPADEFSEWRYEILVKFWGSLKSCFYICMSAEIPLTQKKLGFSYRSDTSKSPVKYRWLFCAGETWNDVKALWGKVWFSGVCCQGRGRNSPLPKVASGCNGGPQPNAWRQQHHSGCRFRLAGDSSLPVDWCGFGEVSAGWSYRPPLTVCWKKRNNPAHKKNWLTSPENAWPNTPSPFESVKALEY